MVHSCLNFRQTTGPFARPFFRRSVSSNGVPGDVDAKTTVATTGVAATAAYKGTKNSRWRRFVLKPFVFVQFFFGIGLLAIALKQFRRKNKHPSQSPELIAKDWEVYHDFDDFNRSFLFGIFLEDIIGSTICSFLDPLLSHHPLPGHISRLGLVDQPSLTSLGATTDSGKMISRYLRYKC